MKKDANEMEFESAPKGSNKIPPEFASIDDEANNRESQASNGKPDELKMQITIRERHLWKDENH